MAQTTTGSVGRSAEERAFRFLCRHGLKPVARNFRTRGGEIDLVMIDGPCLAFIEVRARGQGSFVDACLTVDGRKQAKLIRTASLFLARYPVFRDHPCRFDVVGVCHSADDSGAIDWMRDAFRPAG
jgi:putative endonuclease